MDDGAASGDSGKDRADTAADGGSAGAGPSDGPSERASARSPQSSVKEFVRRRSRALGAMLACACIATCAAPAYPERSEQGVLDLLRAAQGGDVPPGDFVWERSQGFVDDLVFGRRILFLAKTGNRGLRDLHRARVSVTRQGRPLWVHSIVNLSHTELADEQSLSVIDDSAVVVAVAAGHVQSIRWMDLGSERHGTLARRGTDEELADVRSTWVSFSRAPNTVRVDLQKGALVFAIDGDQETVAIEGAPPNVTTSGDRYGVYATREVEHSSRAPSKPWLLRPFSRFARAPTTEPSNAEISWSSRVEPEPAAASFPPSDRFAPAVVRGWEGTPAIFASNAGDDRLLAIDMRQLEMNIVHATDVPASSTGHRAPGASQIPRGSWLWIAGPSSPGEGAIDRGIAINPFSNGGFALADGKRPRIVAMDGTQSPDAGSFLGFVATNASRLERSALCATASGHFVYLWSKGSAQSSLQSLKSSFSGVDCIAMLPIEGDGGMGAAILDGSAAEDLSTIASIDSRMSMQWASAAQSAPILAFTRKAQEPSARAPKGTHWEPLDAPQPEPRFAPAIYHVSTESLGVPVEVRLFMPERFDWVIRAGEKEKMHRMGGQFEKVLSDADKTRAYVAMSLGIGKRKSPFGLRIAGSLGHVFHRGGVALAAGRGSLSIGLGMPDEPETDATELVLTARGGSLASEARERGPRQIRADLCALEDGTVLYAETEFESHEPATTLLTELGCSSVVGLDRGADQAASTETRDHLAAAHDATTLFGLARDPRGPVRVDPPSP